MSARTRRQASHGVSMVEFAILAPLAFLLLLGALDFARAGFTNNATSNAAREGARALIPSQEAGKSFSAKQTDILNAVKTTAGSAFVVDTSALRDGSTLGASHDCHNASVAGGKAQVYLDPFTNPSGNKSITITVCYAFQPWLPLVRRYFPSTFVLGSSSTMTTEY